MKTTMKTIGLVAVATLALVGCGGGGGDNYTTHPYDAPPISQTDKSIYLKEINTIRATGRTCGSLGFFPAVDPLNWSNALYKASYEHSEDMSVSGVFEHVGSGTNSDWTAQVQELGKGSDLDDRAKNNGYISGAGENILMGTNSMSLAFDTWLKSDSHCALIMEDLKNGDYALAKVGIYWTMRIGGE